MEHRVAAGDGGRHLAVGAGVRLAAATLVTFVLGVALAAPASAHAVLLRSMPADGTVLPESPDRVRLWFSETVAAESSSADLRGADGRLVARLDVRAVPGDDQVVDLPVHGLRSGVYRVRWRVLAEADGHYSSGLLVFRVGAGPPPTPAGEVGTNGSVAWPEAALRWMDLASLVAVTGAIAVAGWVLVPAALGTDRRGQVVLRPRRRVLTLATAGVGVAFAAGVGLLVWQAAAVADATRSGVLSASADVLLGSRWGALWLVRQGLLVALGVVLLLALRAERAAPTPARRPWLPLAALLVTALAGSHVLSGHAAAGDSPRVLTVLAATVHLLAAGMWIGGLAAIVVAWPHGGSDPKLVRILLRRFGRLALVGFGLVAATGFYYAGRQVSSAEALHSTLYGRVLVAKTAVFVAVAALGTANLLLARRRSVRAAGPTGPRPGHPRGLIVAEALLGIVVLAGAGVLGATAPARGPQPIPTAAARGADPTPATRAAAPTPPATLTREVNDLLISVTARPNQPGWNVFEVLTASTRRPAGPPVTGVRLRFVRADNGTTLNLPPLTRVAPGRYRVAGRIPGAAAGWQAEAVVERSGLPAEVARFDWYAGGAPPSDPAPASGPRLGPLLTGASVAVLLALAITLAAVVVRDRAARAGPRGAGRVDVRTIDRLTEESP